jgi:AcrR family transcriptional regulator
VKGSRAARGEPTLRRQDWTLAARDAFIRGGVHAVKVDLLARKLGVTRGSFYHHFRNRADLLDALFELWRAQNAEPFEAIACAEHIRGWDRIRKVVDLWLQETLFDPAFESAMRDWARISKRVATAVRAADEARIGLLWKAYREMGFQGDAAFVRARVTYFQQVGYYTLAIRETKTERRRLLPFYLEILAQRAEAPAAAGDPSPAEPDPA